MAKITNKDIMDAIQGWNARFDSLEARIAVMEANQTAPKKAKTPKSKGTSEAGKKEATAKSSEAGYTKRTKEQLDRWHEEYDKAWSKWTKDGTVKHTHAENSRKNREICAQLKKAGF